MTVELMLKPFPVGLELVRARKGGDPISSTGWMIALCNVFRLMEDGHSSKGETYPIQAVKLHYMSEDGSGVVIISGDEDHPIIQFIPSHGPTEVYTDLCASITTSGTLARISAQVVYVSIVIDDTPVPREGVVERLTRGVGRLFSMFDKGLGIK